MQRREIHKLWPAIKHNASQPLTGHTLLRCKLVQPSTYRLMLRHMSPREVEAHGWDSAEARARGHIHHEKVVPDQGAESTEHLENTNVLGDPSFVGNCSIRPGRSVVVRSSCRSRFRQCFAQRLQL